MKMREYRPRLKAEDVKIILEALNVYAAQRLKGMSEYEVDRLDGMENVLFRVC